MRLPLPLLLSLFCLLLPVQVLACGPSPQKVVEQVTIKASPEEVWAVVGDVAGMQNWHPAIKSSTVNKKLDMAQGDDSDATIYRTLQLTSGGKLVERLRPMQRGVMKIGVVIEQGSLAVSNYSDALTVKPGLETGTALVTWTGRFNNKANLLVAPKGQDNETAIAEVTAFYTAGLSQLKQIFSKQKSI